MALKDRLTFQKVSIKLQKRYLDMIARTPLQFRMYRSYWKAKFTTKKQQQHSHQHINFLASKPNYTAGIGHQLSNWNTGYFFAQHFNLRFAHFPFSSEKWEHLLGFGENEVMADSILNDKTYKKVRLPRFQSTEPEHLAIIERIVRSYDNEKVFFLMAQDQGYDAQFATHEALSRKFFAAASRQESKLFYEPGVFSIAVHIRRGDILASSLWEHRILGNQYYVNVLKATLESLGPGASPAIYIFSQGSEDDFSEFRQFDNVHYCLRVNAYDSFVHMACADILISSKSSFSYKPALISKGIKICPEKFWHSYPPTGNFILADEKGFFDQQILKAQLRKNILAEQTTLDKKEG